MITSAAYKFRTHFDVAIAEDIEHSGYPVEEWFWNGPTNPVKAVSDWRDKGPVLVQGFIDWFERSDYEVWIAPDGRPAVELELDVMFGSVPMKMYIDAIFQNRLGLTVFDFKTGTRKPDGWQQLGIYASGVELAYGIRPLYGAYYMARGFGPRGAKPEDLKYVMGPMPLSGSQFTVEFFTSELEAMERGIQAEAFVAHVSKDCERCGVADFCPAIGGALVREG